MIFRAEINEFIGYSLNMKMGQEMYSMIPVE